MREQILDSIYNLYRSHIITAIIFLFLIIITVVTTVLIIKFNIVNSITGRISLIAIVAVCSVLLVISQIVAILPVYQDYKKLSYTVLNNVTAVIKGDTTGLIDRTNTVLVNTQNIEYELILSNDRQLDFDTEYVGSIAFLNHSRYIVWYDFE